MSRLIKNQRILGNIVSLPDQEALHKNLEGLLYKNEWSKIKKQGKFQVSALDSHRQDFTLREDPDNPFENAKPASVIEK